jgi:hypothetical protein
MVKLGPVYVGSEMQDRNSARTATHKWRIVVDGADLKIQRYEDRAWVTKDTISG